MQLATGLELSGKATLLAVLVIYVLRQPPCCEHASREEL